MDNPPPLPAPAAPLQDPAPIAAPAADFGPAGFWIRAGAYLIDGLLVTLGQAVINALLLLAGSPGIVANLLSSAAGIGYFVWMPVATQGQTVGKMAAGIGIIRMDGSPLTYLRCLGRWAAYLVSGIVAGLGFVAAAFTPQKRALHDYLADTRVVYIQAVGNGRKAAVILLGTLFPLLVMAAVMAAVAMPKFGRLADLSQEGAAMGELGSLRAAASLYYGDNNGQYPAQLSDLAPKHLQRIPTLRLKDHPESSQAAAYDGTVCLGKNVDPAKVKDTGHWGYVSDPQATCYGSIFVDCTHTDSKQRQWASY